MATDTAAKDIPNPNTSNMSDNAPYGDTFDDFESDYDSFDDFDALEGLSFGGGAEAAAAPSEADGEAPEEGKSTLEDGAYNIPSPDNAPKFSLESFDDKDTPEERIDALFEQMAPHRKMLLAIMNACMVPCKHEELDAMARGLQAHRHSVYSPTTFCKLLERAGALVKTDEDGVSLEEIVQEPQQVEIEGSRYWTATPAPTVYWALTAAGTAKVASENPRQKIRDLLDGDEKYLTIYAKVLDACAQKGGATMGALGKAVDNDPLLQKPRYYAMRFVDKLEAADAIDWQGSWVATDAGKDALAELNEKLAAKA